MQTRRVLIAEEIPRAAADWLRERCTVVQRRPDEPGFADELAQAEGLVVRTYTRVNEALLARAQRLRVVGRAGVGLDAVDVAACRARGIGVVYTPDANSDAVAELVFAFLHDCTRPRLFLDKALPAPEWEKLRGSLVAPRQINELTIGVLGLGRIGSRIAKLATAYGAGVLWCDLLDKPWASQAGLERVGLQDLARRADVISVHVDPRKENRGLVSAPFLALLRPAAILINTSRGSVVDANDLAAWLRGNPKCRAVLDVHDPEPIGSEYPLLGLPNAHLSPHIGRHGRGPRTHGLGRARRVAVLRGEEPEFPAP